MGRTLLNEKLGSSLIGNLSAVGTGSIRGSTSTNLPVYDFMFTDGANLSETSPGANFIGLFSDALDTVGSGVQLDVVSPTADPYNIYLWGAGFEVAQGTLTATAGGDTATDTSLSQTNSRSPGQFYTVLVDPDFAGQIVNLSLVNTVDSGGGSSHVSIAGVAVDTALAAVPEPASIAIWSLLGLGLAGYGYYRTRC